MIPLISQGFMTLPPAMTLPQQQNTLAMQNIEGLKKGGRVSSIRTGKKSNVNVNKAKATNIVHIHTSKRAPARRYAPQRAQLPPNISLNVPVSVPQRELPQQSDYIRNTLDGLRRDIQYSHLLLSKAHRRDIPLSGWDARIVPVNADVVLPPFQDASVQVGNPLESAIQAVGNVIGNNQGPINTNESIMNLVNQEGHAEPPPPLQITRTTRPESPDRAEQQQAMQQGQPMVRATPMSTRIGVSHSPIYTPFSPSSSSVSASSATQSANQAEDEAYEREINAIENANPWVARAERILGSPYSTPVARLPFTHNTPPAPRPTPRALRGQPDVKLKVENPGAKGMRGRQFAQEYAQQILEGPRLRAKPGTGK